MTNVSLFLSGLLVDFSVLSGYNQADPSTATAGHAVKSTQPGIPEYFNLRPTLEKDYGYSNAVKIGDNLIISGAVSMSDSGVVTGPGDMELRMKNCYNDLEEILTHYGDTVNDIYTENIYTTDINEFERVSGFRNTIYKKQFPTGTWLDVKGLAVPNQFIEIDMEAHRST